MILWIHVCFMRALNISVWALGLIVAQLRWIEKLCSITNCISPDLAQTLWLQMYSTVETLPYPSLHERERDKCVASARVAILPDFLFLLKYLVCWLNQPATLNIRDSVAISSNIPPEWAPSSELFSSGCTIHGSLKQQTKRKFRIFSVHACRWKKNPEI